MARVTGDLSVPVSVLLLVSPRPATKTHSGPAPKIRYVASALGSDTAPYWVMSRSGIVRTAAERGVFSTRRSRGRGKKTYTISDPATGLSSRAISIE